VNEYETILDRLELLEDVQEAERQISAGKVVSHEIAKKKLLRKFKK
jgi:hypothetical protein